MQCVKLSCAGSADPPSSEFVTVLTHATTLAHGLPDYLSLVCGGGRRDTIMDTHIVAAS